MTVPIFINCRDRLEPLLALIASRMRELVDARLVLIALPDGGESLRIAAAEGERTYGIVGMQIGVVEVGRFTLPAIGVMVVTVPDGDGGHAWRPATTLGFGYLIGNFVPPFM